MRVSRDIRENKQNGLIGNSSRRNRRDEWVFLFLHALILIAVSLDLWEDRHPMAIVVKAIASCVIAWRCQADYRDREAASGYHTKIKQLEKKGLI